MEQPPISVVIRASVHPWSSAPPGQHDRMVVRQQHRRAKQQFTSHRRDIRQAFQRVGDRLIRQERQRARLRLGDTPRCAHARRRLENRTPRRAVPPRPSDQDQCRSTPCCRPASPNFTSSPSISSGRLTARQPAAKVHASTSTRSLPEHRPLYGPGLVRNFSLRERRNRWSASRPRTQDQIVPNSGVMSCLGAAHPRRGAWQ